MTKNIVFALVLSLVFLAMPSSEAIEAQGLVEYQPVTVVNWARTDLGDSGYFLVIAGAVTAGEKPQLLVCVSWTNENRGVVRSVDKSKCFPGARGGPELDVGFVVEATDPGETGYVGTFTPSGNLLACYSFENIAGGEVAPADLSKCQSLMS